MALLKPPLALGCYRLDGNVKYGILPLRLCCTENNNNNTLASCQTVQTIISVLPRSHAASTSPNVSGYSWQIPPVPRGFINTPTPECAAAPGADLSSFEEILEFQPGVAFRRTAAPKFKTSAFVFVD